MRNNEELRYSMLAWFEQLTEDNKYIMISQCYDMVQEQKKEALKEEKLQKGRKIVKMNNLKVVNTSGS